MAHGALTNQLQCHPRSNFKGSRRLTKPQPRLELKLGWAWQNWTANPRYLSRWISKHIYWQKIKKGYLWVVKLKNPSSFHHESSPPLNFFRMRLGFSIGLFYKCQGALWNRMVRPIHPCAAVTRWLILCIEMECTSHLDPSYGWRTGKRYYKHNWRLIDLYVWVYFQLWNLLELEDTSDGLLSFFRWRGGRYFKEHRNNCP